ncbi:ABC transporter ATP-binding protein [Niallia alba]|uniref:ABC transporter ATP-binding protein n=1 Tax=Niallia alba TaxID=2729105 RepID=UPI002E1CD8F7|nr:ABC transporter ATP-binding protein [Niallia alba]
MEFKQISFAYQMKGTFIKELSGTIEKNKVTSIIGPNGCGKSTLLSLLARNRNIDAGSITLSGKELSEYKAKEIAKKIAMVYQNNQTSEDVTVEDLIRFGRVPHKSLWQKDSTEDEKIVEWAIQCTNLQSYKYIYLNELSGGQRQRVWIAMALAQKTDILFLDEPTTYLDIYHQIELLQLVRKLNEEYQITIVMVLHDINQALRYSDYVILMKDGKIIASGEPSEVITEKNIKEIYQVDIMLNTEKETGGSYIIPLGI